MRKFLPRFFCLFFLAGCSAGYRTRILLNEAEENLKHADQYRAREFARLEWSEAETQIHTARKSLDERNKKEALNDALKAKKSTEEALRISRKTFASVTMKEAKENRSLVEENDAFRGNEELYQMLISEMENAQKSFMADQFEASIRYSQSVIARSRIILEPLKMQAEIVMGRVFSAWEKKKSRIESPREIEALIKEGGEAFQAKRYKQAVSILEKAEKELELYKD